MKANMKKTAYILLALLACTSVVSCDDLLDTVPRDRVTPETFFKTESQLQAFSMNCYHMLPGADDLFM